MIENFVGIYDDFYSKQECEETIKFISESLDLGFGVGRKKFDGAEKHDKDDTAFFSSNIIEDSVSNYPKTFKVFNERFWNTAYKNYSENFSLLKLAQHHSIYELKYQKTQIGGGYHIWHFENDNKKSSGRLLAFILYLNDVEEGGETEFLYSPKRIKAKQGRLILFPVGFTHAHRGNPPISNEKYILTGWVEF